MHVSIKLWVTIAVLERAVPAMALAKAQFEKLQPVLWSCCSCSDAVHSTNSYCNFDNHASIDCHRKISCCLNSLQLMVTVLNCMLAAQLCIELLLLLLP